MRTLRDYIDLIETTRSPKNIQEWPFGKKPQEPSADDISNRIFNRPGMTSVAAPEPKNFGFQSAKEPSNLSHQDSSDLQNARQFSSADAYAYSDFNPYVSPTNNIDPPHIQKHLHDEAARLKSQWIFWKNAGLIK